jgi:hypothetical protein
MQVRLTKKFANLINGCDLTTARVGDLMTVTDHQGEMLIAEGWAVAHAGKRRSSRPEARGTAHAADAARKRKRDSSDA